MSNNKYIAETIIDQLGGNKFIAMTGSKDFQWDEKTLTLSFSLSSLAQKKAKGNTIQIQYDNIRDSYNVRLIKQLKPTLKRILDKVNLWQVLKTDDDVYFDALQDIFWRWTGLYTHL